MLIATAPTDSMAMPGLRCLRSTLQARLAQVVPAPAGDFDLIANAMRDATLAPGKRLRPLLLMLVGRALGADPERLVDPACAVEMVHTASLVLDDLPCMDDALQRRGRPTIHVRHGQDVAILSAVALLSQAFRLIASGAGLAARQRIDLVEVLATAVGPKGLVQGQCDDLRPRAASPRPDEIADTNALKTGALFAAAFDMAAIVADAGAEPRARLRDCAADIGQAFQLRDDLGDRAPGSVTGKDSGKDEGKATLVALIGRQQARDRLASHVGRASGNLRQLFPHEPALADLVAHIAGEPV